MDRPRKSEMHYDRQPFVSNGYFTANPGSEPHTKTGHIDDAVHSQQNRSGREDTSKEAFRTSGKTVSRSHERSQKLSPVRDAEIDTLHIQRKSRHDENRGEGKEVRNSFVSPMDFKRQDFNHEKDLSRSKVQLPVFQFLRSLLLLFH